MKIRIDSPNMHKVKAALAKVNGKAVTHTADERDIVYAVEFAERKMGQAGIAKHRRQGATYTFVSGNSLPNNYRYLNGVTRNRVTLTRGKKDWFLTAVDVVTGIKSPPKDVFAIDPAGVDDILDNLGMTPKEPDTTLLQKQLLSTIYGRIDDADEWLFGEDDDVEVLSFSHGGDAVWFELSNGKTLKLTAEVQS